MSTAHLAVGSQDPPKTEGLLRVYSMLYCPFAQRVRLVLKAKQIPHEVVNINLVKKPEWYLKINPEGKVPTLIDGSKVIVESLDISEYLEEKYPNNPLYPADPEAKQKDKELIQKIGPVLKVFGQTFYTNEKGTLEESLKNFLEVLQVFEDELAKRGTPFFGGSKPGMVDYMFWPWAERAPLIGIKYGKKPSLQDDQIPLLRKWRKSMREDPTSAELYNPVEKYWKLIQYKLSGEEPPYDSI